MPASTAPHTSDLIAHILTQQLKITLPDDQLIDLWRACETRLKNVELHETLAHIHQTQARTPSELDTLERGDVLTSLAMVLIGDDWPSNADAFGGRRPDFHQMMVDGMKACGYTPSVPC